MPERVNVVTPQGRTISVPAKDAGLFYKLGYRQESSEERTGRLTEDAIREHYEAQPVQTLWEGAKSGLSLGFSDLNASREEEMRAKYNPGYRLTGEIGAIVGTALLNPSSAAGRVGLAAIPSGAAATLGRAAGSLGRTGLRSAIARGAAEGGVQGVGQVVSNYGLRGDPLTAESLLAGAGLGTVFGVGAETLGYGLMKGGKALRESGEAFQKQRVSIQKATDSIPDADYSSLRTAVRSLKAETRKAAEEADSLLSSLKTHNSKVGAARFADIDLPVSAAPTPKAAVEAASKGTLDLGPEIRKLKTHADELFGFASLDPALSKTVAPELSKIRKLYGQFDEVLKSKNVGKGAKYYDEYYDAIESLAAKMDEPMIPRISATKTYGPVGKALQESAGAAAKLTGKIEQEVAKMAGEFSPEILAGVQSRLQSLRAAMEVSDLLPNLPKSKEAFFNLSKVERSKVVDALERAGGLKDFPSAAQLVEKMEALSSKLGIAMDGTPAQRLGKTMEIINEGPKVSISGSLKKPKNKARNEILKGGLARMMGTLAGKAFPGFARPFARQAGYVLGKNAAGFAIGYLASGGDAMSGVAAAVALQGSVRSRLKRAAGRILSGTGRGVAMSSPAMMRILDNSAFNDDEAPSKSLKEAATRRSKEISELTSGTAANWAYAGLGEIREHSPDLAKQMEEKSIEIINYLAANLPRDPGTVMIGGKSRWEMTEQQARMSADIIYGAYHPLEAYEDFVEGKISPYALRSFKDLWPNLHMQASELIVEDLPKILKKADSHQRSQLSYLLDFPVSSLNDPKIAKSFQEDLLNAPNQAMQAKQPVNKPSGSAQSLQTSAQKLTDR